MCIFGTAPVACGLKFQILAVEPGRSVLPQPGCWVLTEAFSAPIYLTLKLDNNSLWLAPFCQKSLHLNATAVPDSPQSHASLHALSVFFQQPLIHFRVTEIQEALGIRRGTGFNQQHLIKGKGKNPHFVHWNIAVFLLLSLDMFLKLKANGIIAISKSNQLRPLAAFPNFYSVIVCLHFVVQHKMSNINPYIGTSLHLNSSSPVAPSVMILHAARSVDLSAIIALFWLVVSVLCLYLTYTSYRF